MELSLNLEEHGWLDIVVTTKERQEIEISASFLYDCLDDMAGKTAALAEGAVEAIATVQTEPGEYRFRFIRLDADRCRVQLFKMGDNFSSKAIKEGRRLLSEEMELLRLLRIVQREFTGLQALGGEEYKRRWSSDFPADKVERISRAIKRIKKERIKF